MNNTHVINQYIEALSTRAEMSEDSRLDFAMGFLYNTLQAMKLNSYELEVLKQDTDNLNKLIGRNYTYVTQP